jgi:hypothetical protein
MVIQRDMRVDAGIEPVREAEVLEARRRGAQAIQAVFRGLGFPEISDAEVEAATTAYASDDMPERDLVADLAAADAFLDGPLTAFDVAQALEDGGFADIAENIRGMQRVRVAGEYLQPAAILTLDFATESAFSDGNDYLGPGTGFRLEGEEWRRIAAIPQARSAEDMVPVSSGKAGISLREKGAAAIGTEPEVVVAVGPAFAGTLDTTLCGLSHGEVLREILAGIASQGIKARIVKVFATADCGMIGHEGARLSGSGIAVGLQSEGTAVIQRRGLAPLNNLELFAQAPLLSRAAYRRIGANAASHALRRPPDPVPVKVDNMARLRLIVHALLMHKREVACVERGRPAMDMEIAHGA